METPRASTRREHRRRPETETRRDQTLTGRLLTIISLVLLTLMALLAVILGMLYQGQSQNVVGPDSARQMGPFLCHTQACADEAGLTALGLFGFVAYVVVTFALVLWSTDLALKLAAIGSFIVAGILLILLVTAGVFALLVAGVPLMLGIGSVLRLAARRGTS